MAFSVPGHWIWDSWTAVDGDTTHLYYLRAPRSLGDPDLRHRNASIGHATTTDPDLRQWTDHGVVLERGPAGSLDASATWTGSIVRDPSGLWRMHYTGSVFLRDDAGLNVETVLAATSSDLHHWDRVPGWALSADPRWYETLADATWREEAWRDPWVEPDPGGDGWHMLVTARAPEDSSGGDPLDRGVVGHAKSRNLVTWTTTAPLSQPGSGFAHLEVLQVATVEGRRVLVFSCAGSDLAGARAGDPGGIFALPLADDEPFGDAPLDLPRAHLVVGEELYAGRVVHTARGAALLGFENVSTDGNFTGRILDPLPLRWDAAGRLVAERHRFAS
jgi:beta-fructofuranosidase